LLSQEMTQKLKVGKTTDCWYWMLNSSTYFSPSELLRHKKYVWISNRCLSTFSSWCILARGVVHPSMLSQLATEWWALWAHCSYISTLLLQSLCNNGHDARNAAMHGLCRPSTWGDYPEEQQSFVTLDLLVQRSWSLSMKWSSPLKSANAAACFMIIIWKDHELYTPPSLLFVCTITERKPGL
jgi:hypothetical protein